MIQKFWRSRYPKILEKRTFFKTTVGKLYVRALEICKKSAASRMMRHLLTGYAVKLHETIHDSSSIVFELQQRAVKLSISLPQEHFEHVDEVIERVSGIEELLENVAETISMSRLEEVAGGELCETERLLRNADSALDGVASDIRKAVRMVEAIKETDEL